MEYLFLTAALILCLVLVFLKQMYDQKKADAQTIKKLKENFGKENDVWDPERVNAVSGYFRHHQDTFFIDDITYHDLELDRIFAKMDITGSSAGQEYLYYMLRTPSFNGQELAEREQKIRFLIEEEQTRVRLQFLYRKLGRTNKYSIYDYLEFLDTLGERRNGKHFAGWLLMGAALVILAVSAPLGLTALFGVISWNIVVYMKEKSKIEPYLVCFRYLFRAIEAAEKIGKVQELKKDPLFADWLQKLQRTLRQFDSLKRSGRFGMHVMGGNGNPLELAADYSNMLLHLDLIGFNRMLHQVRIHHQDVDQLLTSLGETEALIAAASYRKALPVCCVPELSENDTAEDIHFTAHDLYHPLIRDAVKNDIHAERGVLITGSNASGKSTFLKAAAINAIFAQTIHTCAASCYGSSFFRVMSSMALRDNLTSSESYYIVEIRSLKRILDNIEKDAAPVLCFVDEVLRGTNTVERIAASTKILESMYGKNVLCFAATHDIELTELLENCYDNYHFEEQIENGDIHFPYELLPGKATSRNAIRLLAVMGYEEEIISSADWLAAYFLANGHWEKTMERKE